MSALMSAFGVMVVLAVAIPATMSLLTWLGELLMLVFPERRVELAAIRITRRVRRTIQAIQGAWDD